MSLSAANPSKAHASVAIVSAGIAGSEDTQSEAVASSLGETPDDMPPHFLVAGVRSGTGVHDVPASLFTLPIRFTV